MFGRRNRKKPPLASILLAKMETAITLMALVAVFQYARFLGLPERPLSFELFLYLVCFRFLNVAIHESGHALMAWVQMAEIREVAVGPLCVSRPAGEAKVRFQLNAKEANWFGGRIKAVGLSLVRPRMSRILFAAGGPLANLITAALLLLVFFLLPGTAFAGCWWIVAANMVLAATMGIFNLAPVSRRDGAQIIHPLLWTAQGKELIARDRFGLAMEAAEAARGNADFETAVRIYQDTLNSIRYEKTGNPITTAYGCYLLGFAQMGARNWPAAQAAFDESLKMESFGNLGHDIAAGAWFGLHKSLVERNHKSEASAIYFRALGALTRRKKDKDPEVRYLATAMLAELNLNEGHCEEALRETGELMQLVRSSKLDAFQQAVAWILQTDAQLSLGYTEEALGSARQAEAQLSFGEIPAARRNLGWFTLGELGEILAKHRQPVLAEAYLRDAVGHLGLAGAQDAAVHFQHMLARQAQLA